MCDHLRDHLSELPFHTANSLADQVGISRPGMIRLLQRLGYRGFTEARDQSRASLRQATSPLQRFKPAAKPPLLAEKVRQAYANLDLTLESTGALIAKAVSLLSKAQRVFVLGGGKSYGVAVYLHHLLRGVRPEVHLLAPLYGPQITELRRDDLLAVCLFQRYYRESIRILTHAYDNRVPALVITDGASHDFLKRAQLALVAATDSSTLFRSMIGPLLLIETLVAELANANPDTARRVLEATEVFNRERLMWK